MILSPWYHVFAVDGWESIVGEFLDAFTESGLAEEAGVLHLGVVGSPWERADVIATVAERVPELHVAVEAAEGWEQVTLRALHRAPCGDAVLYAHTKGVAVHSAWNDAWRRSMTLSTVTDWRRCVELLADHQAVGCHWLDPGEYIVNGRSLIQPQTHGFFGGNFWWARASLVRTLDPPRMETRYDAECWIGTGGLTATDVADLAPGWPSLQTIRQEARAR